LDHSEEQDLDGSITCMLVKDVLTTTEPLGAIIFFPTEHNFVHPFYANRQSV